MGPIRRKEGEQEAFYAGADQGDFAQSGGWDRQEKLT